MEILHSITHLKERVINSLSNTLIKYSTFTFLFVATCTRCPTDFSCSKKKDRCFYINTKKLSWNDAQTFCQSKDSLLVSIENDEKNNEIKTILTDHRDQDFWIGAQFDRNQNQWKWVKKEGDVNFTIFTDNSQISNYVIDGEKEDNIRLTFKDDDWIWGDQIKGKKYFSICEYKFGILYFLS